MTRTASKQGARARAKGAPRSRTIDYASRAGKADEVVQEKTGRTWREWVRVLDADNASSLPHREIAILISQKHGVADWWTQTVAVGYERIKGLREIGQRRSGDFEAGKSCTLEVPVEAAYAVWVDDTRRTRLLDGVQTAIRTASPCKSLRLQWPDGTIVIVGFTRKGPRKSNVAVVHTKLRTKAAAERAKRFWGERLPTLATLVRL